MIPIEREPEEVTKEFTTPFGVTMEHCYFCHNKTLYWHIATNTPVCETCSEIHKEKDIKKEKLWNTAKKLVIKGVSY